MLLPTIQLQDVKLDFMKRVRQGIGLPVGRARIYTSLHISVSFPHFPITNALQIVLSLETLSSVNSTHNKIIYHVSM